MKIYYLLFFLITSYLTIAQSSTCDGNCEDGYGVKIDAKGNRFEGNWSNKLKNGKFKIFYSSGSFFEGLIVNDTISGLGTYETKNFIKKGVLKQIFGENTFQIVLEGDGEYLSKIQNSGKRGFFINDILNGKGESWIGRQVEKGEFVNGELEGVGTFTFENGDYFEGQFKNGKRSGKGVEYYSKGGKLVGSWLNDKFIDGPTITSSTGIPIKQLNDGIFRIDVSFEGQLTIPMIFDTGADILLLSKEHFFSLLSEGKIQKIINKSASFKDASGNSNEAVIYLISKITVGKYVLKDVVCGVNKSATSSPNLFGMSAIRKLGNTISINFTKKVIDVID